MRLAIIAVIFFLLCFFLALKLAFAEPFIDTQRLADAIFKAENSKSHPYGIMVKYKHTTPRQACLNTINNRLKLYKGNSVDEFIVFLGLRYSPPDINPNWVRLVKYFYHKGEK